MLPKMPTAVIMATVAEPWAARITVVRMNAKGRSQMASTFGPILDCRCGPMPVCSRMLPKAPPAQQMSMIRPASCRASCICSPSFLVSFTREVNVQSARPAAMASAMFLSPRMDIKRFRVSGALVCPIKVPPAMSRTGRAIGVRDVMSEGSSEVSLAESASSCSMDSGLSRNGISIRLFSHTPYK